MSLDCPAHGRAMLSCIVVLSLLLLGIAVPARAQSGSARIGGSVVADSGSAPVAGATVSLTPGGRSTRTNYAGEFQFQNLEAGNYVLEIRHVGFAPSSDTVALKAAQLIDRDFPLFHAPVRLDSLAIVATTNNRSYLSEFESRRQQGFGRFVDSTELRHKADGHSFVNYLASHFPGLSITQKRDPSDPAYLSSGRATCSGRAFLCGQPSACLVAMYVDGLPVYIPGQTASGPPDLDAYKSEDYAAVEWYPSGATAPSQYNSTGSVCGVMLLWRHR